MHVSSGLTLSLQVNSFFLVLKSLLFITGLVADVSRSMGNTCSGNFLLLKLLCFKPDPVEEQWVARPNNCPLGFLLAISPWQAFLVLVLTLLGLQNLSSQIFLEDAPLALGPNFGLSVEFWVRLLLLKTQVHIVIPLGTPRDTITKTPLTMLNFCDWISLDALFGFWENRNNWMEKWDASEVMLFIRFQKGRCYNQILSFN